MKITIIAIIIMGLFSPMAFADDSKKGVKKLKKQVERNTKQINTNTTNIDSLATKVNNLPTGGGGTGTDPQVQVNTTAISNLNTQVQTNTGNISSNAAQIQGNTATITGVSAEAQANTASNAAQTAQIQANAASNAAQDTQIQTNTAAVNSVTTSSLVMQGSVDSLTSQVGTIQSDLNVQGTQVQSNSDGVAGNTARIVALENGTGGGGTTPPPEPPPEPAPTIDFTLYIPNASTKDFQFTNSGSCNTVNQTITRVDDAAGSDITIIEAPTGLIGDCPYTDTRYRLTTSSFSIMAYSFINPVVAPISFTYNAPGGTILNDSMGVGKTFGFALSSVENPLSAIIQKSTILSIEPSMTVLAGTFSNCLKIQTSSVSGITTPGNIEQVSWLCEGIGEVKRMRIGLNNSMGTMELRSFTP